MAIELGTQGKDGRSRHRRRLALAALLLMGVAGGGVLHFRPPRIMGPLRTFRSGAAALAREIAVTYSPRTAELLAAMAPRTNEGAAARDALTRLGAPAVRVLTGRLKHRDPPTRAAAALVLGHIGDARAVAPLVRVLRDPDEIVRFRAVYALGLLKDRTVVGDMVPLLADRSPDVVQVTIRALEECHCKVHSREPLPGYKALPWGQEKWQEIEPEDVAPAPPADSAPDADDPPPASGTEPG